ncbi:hypothetical protein SPHV1_520042 [Novosphingobium sp. KN65.2]|nr:hypothetical protein SPHV1_520042 [Novosphingobium sp. KN65.2]
MRGSKLTYQHFGNGQPRGMFHDDLPLTSCRRQEGNAFAVAIDQAAEGETAAGAGGKHVAVHQSWGFFGRVLAQPDLVCGAILAAGGFHVEHQPRGIARKVAGRDRFERRPGRLGAVRAEYGHDARRFAGFAAQQDFGLHRERGGDPVHPCEREVAHAGFKSPDRLRRRRRRTGCRDIGKREALLQTDVTDAIDHGLSCVTDLVSTFLQACRFGKEASEPPQNRRQA